MDLNEILVFTKVVEAGSFIGASRALHMPKSTVSRKVSDLEERLGARLLQRTTRKLSLTDVGQAFYQHAARVVAEAEEAEHVVNRMQEVPRGLLRVTTLLNFGYLGPNVASFLARYTEVQIEMVCADRVVELIQESVDLAVRAGPLADSALIARSLGVLRSYAVASPAFLEKNGTPTEPHDLERFDCVVLDLHMPGISGFDVQAALAATHAGVPVVVITGHDTPQSRQRALQLGAKAYLCKPVDDDTLLPAIVAALGPRSS